MKAALEKANQKLEERIESIVTEQYCTEHDTYASVEKYKIEPQAAEKTQHQIQYRYCCDELQEKVKNALAEAGVRWQTV